MRFFVFRGGIIDVIRPGLFRLCLVLFVACVGMSFPAFAQCNTPAGAESQTRFTAGVLYYCNGTTWQRMDNTGGGGGLGCIEGNVAVPHNGSGTFYSATVGDCATLSETRTCTDGVLSGSFTHASCTADPCTTGPIGTVCTVDGSIFIGMNGTYRIYARAGDSSAGIAWKTTNTTTTGTSSVSDGSANTDAMIAAGAGAHPAAAACRAHGAEWYVPAHDELDLFWLNRVQINLASISMNTGGTFYRGSNEVTSSFAAFQRFNDGSKTGALMKTDTGLRLRCVRREGSAPPPCSGASVGGFCWYASAGSGNCTTTCATHGGYNAATHSYAGGGGDNTNCAAVLDALGLQMGSVTTGGSATHGCGRSTMVGRIRYTGTTTEGSNLPSLTRACACNN